MPNARTIASLPPHVLRRQLLTAQTRCGQRAAELRKIIRTAQAELDELAERERDIEISLFNLDR